MAAASEQHDGIFEPAPTKRPFEALVDLDARWRGNRLDQTFPVSLVLEAGFYDMPIPAREGFFKSGSKLKDDMIVLRIRLRHCFVRYESSGIRLLSHTKYRSLSQPGSIEVSSSATLKRSDGSRVGAAIGGNADLNPMRPTAGMTLKGHAEVSRQRGRVTRTETHVNREIFEIDSVPNGWQVGDIELGDPTKFLGCLQGRYFDRPTSDYPDTFQAEFVTGSRSGTITLWVTVRDGFHVTRLDESEAKGDEKAEVVNIMRDRVAALTIERRLGGPLDFEVPIASKTCYVERATDVIELKSVSVQAQIHNSNEGHLWLEKAWTSLSQRLRSRSPDAE